MHTSKGNAHHMVTPHISCPALAYAVGVSNLWLKREDLHPFGSHKGRSIPRMIEHSVAKGARHFVISSSGNAAIAAVYTIKRYNQKYPDNALKLTVYLGDHISNTKFNDLRSLISDSHYIAFRRVPRPKQSAFQTAKHIGAVLLRQSVDDSALQGYSELAEELAEISNLSAVFVPTSSGTTAQGLGEAFQSMGKSIEVHIVQTVACCPIATALNTPDSLFQDPGFRTQEPSLATAIVDHVAFRKQKVRKSIERSGGGGWIATNQEIEEAIGLVKKETSIDISPNSALSVVGLLKAVRSGWRPSGAIVCLLTGS